MKKELIIIGGVAVLVLGIGIILAIQDEKTTKLAVPNKSGDSSAVGQEFANLGQKHIQPGEAHDPYNSNPPTSGAHLIQPAEWGVYPNPLQDGQAVHNEEHGGIWISYKGIDDQTKASLEKIAKANPGSIIMSPRDANDAKIVLASWTRMEKLDGYDEDKILEFIRSNKNKSPEPVAK